MNRLKRLRKEKNETQYTLAELLSVNEKTISRWENGESNIKPDKAQQLADFFGVSVGYLLGYEEEPLLEGIARDLSNQITEEEWEIIHANPEEEEYYMSIAWDRMLKSKNDPETVLSTKRFTEVKNITDLETLDGLISDTLLANKLLDRLKQKILSSEIINAQDYNYEIETVLSWLIDFNDALSIQKLDLMSKNKK